MLRHEGGEGDLNDNGYQGDSRVQIEDEPAEDRDRSDHCKDDPNDPWRSK